MTDPASLLSALIAQPGATALGSLGGAVLLNAASGSGIGLPAGVPTDLTIASGKPCDGSATTVATNFQAALALQGQIPAIIAPPAPVKPGIAGPAARLLQAPVAPLAQASVPARPSVAEPVTPPSLAHPPLQPAVEAAAQAEPLATPATQPGTPSAKRSTDGKLPKTGNILPVLPVLAPPGGLLQRGTAKAEHHTSDDPTDDKSTRSIGVTDAFAQPLPALVGAAVQPLPPAAIDNGAVRSTRLASAATTPAFGPPTPAPKIVGPAAPSPTTPGAPATVLLAAQSSTPATVAPQAVTIAVSPVLSAQSAPVALAQLVPNSIAGVSFATLQPAVMAMAAPTLASPPPASPPSANLSTAGRLARQSGVPRGAIRDTPMVDSSGALAPTIGTLAVAVDPASATAGTTAPAPAAPQDFAALVDRLLEARASAQGSTAPQRISTSVTHADFGKVSLTFQQDTAGLSVSMASADPGFARAAQSAIAGSAQAGASQGFAQPHTPAPANPAASSQGASFSAANGGAPQSQAQPQPQQRPGFIAAATRPPAASGSGSGGTAATRQGIFA